MITQIPQISFSEVTTISWVGDVYQIGGVEYDFSQLLDGEVLPKEALDNDLVISDITRIGAELNFTYIRQYLYETESEDDKTPPTLDNTKDSV